MITPGPWKEVVDRFEMTVKDAKGEVICSFNDHESNAQLIAAAPDLLEALQGAIQVWEGDGTTNIGDWLANAQTAIAKATGEKTVTGDKVNLGDI